MRRLKTALPIVITFICITSPSAWGQAPETVTIRPQETDELLANPGMGWQTFMRSRDKDKNLPDWIPSTVHYARWGWGVLEPRPGEIDYAFLDKTLQETRAAGQKLAFRVMCCSTSPGRPYQPDWLPQAGCSVLTVDYSGQEGLTIPDLDDPNTLAMHLRLIQRLGERYDGHPDIDHVDLGTVGWWGEWHMSSSKVARMPTMENRKLIIDTYVNAFRKTPLVMLVGDAECLAYAAERGAGWRADCLGDMGGFSKNWHHMRDAYPRLVQTAGVQDTWKRAPVAWETCWEMRKWVAEDWSLRYIFNYALALHGSYLNNKSAPLPVADEVRPEIERFLRRLGGAHEHRSQVAEYRVRPLLPPLSSCVPAHEQRRIRQDTGRISHGRAVDARLGGAVHRGIHEAAPRPAAGGGRPSRRSRDAAWGPAGRCVRSGRRDRRRELGGAHRTAGHQRPLRRRLVSAGQVDGIEVIRA
jgi:hypothetical protein